MRKSYKQFYKAPRRHIQVWEAANGPDPQDGCGRHDRVVDSGSK